MISKRSYTPYAHKPVEIAPAPQKRYKKRKSELKEFKFNPYITAQLYGMFKGWK